MEDSYPILTELLYYVLDPSLYVLIVGIGLMHRLAAGLSEAFFGNFASGGDERGSELGLGAVLLPLVSSCVLVLLYFFEGLSLVLTVVAIFTSFCGVLFVALPLSEVLYDCTGVPVPEIWKGIGVADVSAAVAAFFAVALWFFVGGAALTDLLAACAAVAGVALLRVPSMRIGSAFLLAFLLYDVTWVFLAAFVFERSPMVAVAEKARALPMMIEVPLYLSDRTMALGLGDVVLPGTLVAYFHRFDWEVAAHTHYGYIATFAYALGLLATVVVMISFQTPQPALLYLVPAVILIPALVAYRRRHLSKLWLGYESWSWLSQFRSLIFQFRRKNEDIESPELEEHDDIDPFTPIDDQSD